jgi:putative restriction endonuclease
MSVNFSELQTGKSYSRPTLAALWGYSSFQALSRGVVTPKGDNKIILFITEEKQRSAEQYADRLNGDLLLWEGPSDHFAEDRMVRSKTSGEEIHVFYRARHHSDFIYLGQVEVLKHVPRMGKPSEFELRVL